MALEFGTPVVHTLIEEFGRLPGIGPRTAQRLTFFLLRAPVEQSNSLAKAIVEMKASIVYCTRCFNISEQPLCRVCSNESRDRAKICVVEDPLDVIALEKTGSYDGTYHVLHGIISPVDGIGPEDLNIDDLVARVETQQVSELVLATNPNLEGEATAMYIGRLVSGLGIRVTRLARGLPVGADLEYADEVTLSRAIEGRREF